MIRTNVSICLLGKWRQCANFEVFGEGCERWSQVPHLLLWGLQDHVRCYAAWLKGIKCVTDNFLQTISMLMFSPLAVDGKAIGNINATRTGMDWISFETVLRRSKQFADGLLQLGLGPKSTFGIYSMNSSEYTLAEYSCYRHSIIVIPIYETLGSNVCAFISKQGTTWRFPQKGV